MRYYLFLFVFFIISGCVSVNKNPDILLEEPYRKVKYVAEPDNSHEILDVIQVTTRGLQANILNTIPQLYKKALDRSVNNRQVQIANISIVSFTKKENFQVPYQDCKSVTKTVPVQRTNCVGGSCTTTYSTQMQQVQVCTTRYRTEIRDVLYQKATADILAFNEGE